MMSNDRGVQEGDKVLDITNVGSAESEPEGLKVVYLVRRGRQYMVEEQTAFSYRAKFFDSQQRKRDAQQAYVGAAKTTVLTLPPRVES